MGEGETCGQCGESGSGVSLSLLPLAEHCTAPESSPCAFPIEILPALPPGPEDKVHTDHTHSATEVTLSHICFWLAALWSSKVLQLELSQFGFVVVISQL